MKLQRFISLLLLLSMLLTLVPIVGASSKGVSLTTDAAFFAKLDLSQAALSSVRTAVEKGNYTAAKAELLKHYQSTFSAFEPSPATETNMYLRYQVMHDTIGFSEYYRGGIDVTSTNYARHSIDIGTDSSGVYILDQLKATVDGVAIGSRESNTPPQLELYGSDGTLLKTLTAIADTTVRPTKTVSAGYGTSGVLYAKHAPDTKNQLPYSSASMRAYIKFDTSQIPSGTKKVRLVVYAKRSPGNADKVLVEDSLRLEVFSSYCKIWEEATLDWDYLMNGSYIGHFCYDGLEGGFNWKKPKGTPSEWLNYNTRFYETTILVRYANSLSSQSEKDLYMSKAKEHILDFINDSGAGWPTGRDIEGANRALEFPYIYKHLVTGGYLSADENIRILSWLYDEATFLHNGAAILFDGPTTKVANDLVYTNRGIWHLAGFYSIIAYFPEFSDNPSWREIYEGRLTMVMNALVHEDGSYNEVTFGYPSHVVTWCAHLRRIMQEVGDDSDNAEMFSRKMIKLTKYLIDCSYSNGTPPHWGQGGPPSALATAKTALASFSEAEKNSLLGQQISYFVNHSNGVEPPRASQYDEIKVVSDRTGWNSTDTMFFMNAKCAGNHSHRDALAILLYFQGRALLADTGMTSYDGNHAHFPFQNSATRSHNTIEVDGTAQALYGDMAETAHLGDIQIRANDAVSTIYSWSEANNKNKITKKVVGGTTSNVYHSANFVHTRNVSFIKALGNLLIVTDMVVPDDTKTHTYTQNWHSSPYANPTVATSGALLGSTAFSSGANLLIAQAASLPGIQASIQSGYSADAPSVNTEYFEYKQTASGTVTYQTILYPTASGANVSVVPEQLFLNVGNETALAAKVSISDSENPNVGEMYHYNSFESTPLPRSFGDYTTNAKTAIVGLDNSKNPIFASISDGSSLESDSVVLSAEGLSDLAVTVDGTRLALFSSDAQAKTTTIQVKLGDARFTEVILNGSLASFTQEDNGLVTIRNEYVFIGFGQGDIADETSQWSAAHATATVDVLNGVLKGEITAADPCAYMNSSSEDLLYTAKAGDIIELRLKTNLTESVNGTQIFFALDHSSSYTKEYATSVATISHPTEDFTTVVFLIPENAAYLGKTISRLRVDMVSSNSGSTATGSYEIDYIYIGPKEKSPSAQICDSLFFDFTDNTKARARYASGTYSGLNFDQATKGYWATSATNGTNQFSIDNTEGTLSVNVIEGPDTAGGYGPWIKTTTTHNCFPWASEPHHIYYPLYYDPKNAQVAQVRFKLVDCVVPEGKTPEMALIFDYKKDGTLNVNGSMKAPINANIDTFQTLTLELSETFLNADSIRTIGMRFHNISSFSGGKIVIDYIYVGPRDSLYFGFSDTTTDRERYEGKVYDGFNYDINNWVGRSSSVTNLTFDTTQSQVHFTSKDAAQTYHYIQTSTNTHTTDAPLNYVPSANDHMQIRFRIDHAVVGTAPALAVHYQTGDRMTISNNDCTRYTIRPTLIGTGYHTITFPMGPRFTAADFISNLRIGFEGISSAEGSTAEFAIDYIYVGDPDDAPQQSSLFFDFMNTEADRTRYAGAVYGSTNFDLQTNWYHRRSTLTPVKIDTDLGVLTTTIVPTATVGEHFVQTSKGSATSVPRCPTVPHWGIISRCV